MIAGVDGEPRCWWCGDDPIYVAYHDDDWGTPIHDDRALLELLCLEGFQAGLSWITILRKRPAFQAAFEGFEPEVVAGYGEADIERLLADAGIVRHRGKIEATIANAQAVLDAARRRPDARRGGLGGRSRPADRPRRRRRRPARRSPSRPPRCPRSSRSSASASSARRRSTPSSSPPESSTTTSKAAGAPMARKRPADRLRTICLALPEAYEKPTWESATFRVGRDKIFAMLVDEGAGAWMKADPEERLALLEDPDERYFYPRTSATRAGSASSSPTPEPTGTRSASSSARATSSSPPRSSASSSTECAHTPNHAAMRRTGLDVASRRRSHRYRTSHLQSNRCSCRMSALPLRDRAGPGPR